MDTPLKTDTQSFRRDRLTIYHYLILALFGFKQSVMGSIMPFLRDEMSLTTGQIGWHFSIYALGLILSARVVNQVERYLPLEKILKFSVVAMVVVILLIMFTTTIATNLALALLLGLTGGSVQIVVQSNLAAHHNTHQGVALVEAFVFAAFGVFFGPLAIGFASQTEYGWRVAMVLPIVILMLIHINFRNLGAVKHHSAENELQSKICRTHGRLPLYVLMVLAMILLGIATEWGLGFWGALFLEVKLSITPSEAVSTMSVFFGGTVIGRIVASRLLLLFSLRPMLLILIVLGGISVLVLAFSNSREVAWVGLFVGGACLGNFFPLILAVANEYAPDRTTDVSRAATLMVGVSLLIVPYIIGALGDRVGLTTVIGLLAFLPLGMLLLLIVSQKMKKRLR